MNLKIIIRVLKVLIAFMNVKLKTLYDVLRYQCHTKNTDPYSYQTANLQNGNVLEEEKVRWGS